MMIPFLQNDVSFSGYFSKASVTCVILHIRPSMIQALLISPSSLPTTPKVTFYAPVALNCCKSLYLSGVFFFLSSCHFLGIPFSLISFLLDWPTFIHLLERGVGFIFCRHPDFVPRLSLMPMHLFNSVVALIRWCYYYLFMYLSLHMLIGS